MSAPIWVLLAVLTAPVGNIEVAAAGFSLVAFTDLPACEQYAAEAMEHAEIINGRPLTHVTARCVRADLRGEYSL